MYLMYLIEVQSEVQIKNNSSDFHWLDYQGIKLQVTHIFEIWFMKLSTYFYSS